MKGKKGFTLIELVIVLILIGILAAVAVPKFLDLEDEAKKNGVKGSLASVRSAINIYYANASLKNKTTKFPPSETVLNTLFNGPVPENPLSKATTPADRRSIDVTTAANPPAVTAADTNTTKPGWRYNPNTGQFWSNWGGGFGANTF